MVVFFCVKRAVACWEIFVYVPVSCFSTLQIIICGRALVWLQWVNVLNEVFWGHCYGDFPTQRLIMSACLCIVHAGLKLLVWHTSYCTKRHMRCCFSLSPEFGPENTFCTCTVSECSLSEYNCTQITISDRKHYASERDKCHLLENT